MPLIDIVQEALSEVGNISPLPSTIVNNSNDLNAVKALAMVNGLGKDLMRQYKWPELLVPNYQFTTVIGQAAYALPSDFRRMVPLTQWDFTAKWALNGGATDSFWAALQSGIITVGLRMWFQIQGVNFVLAPTPTDAREIVYTYYRNTWVSSQIGVPQTAFLADTDYPAFMPNGEAEDLMRLGLIYKWKASNGLPYAEDKANYLSAIDADIFDAHELPIIDTTGIIRYTVGRGNIPESGFGGV